MAVFELKDISAVGRTAISAQQIAREAGVQWYAGFHYGEVEFRETMRHPDALGLTVNLAARLHKLTEGVPGRIFLADDTRNLLDPELRARTGRWRMTRPNSSWCISTSANRDAAANRLEVTEKSLFFHH